MKIILKKSIIFLGAIIQVTLLAVPWIINYLCNTKAGVMHHVYYRKVQYLNGIYNPTNLNLQIAISLIIFCVFIYSMIKIIKKYGFFTMKIELFIGIIASIFLVIVSKYSYFINQDAYPYFIMSFELIVILQILICGLIKIIERK